MIKAERSFTDVKKYAIIYADPPWKYQGGKVRGAGVNHYPVIPLDELCDLPVSKFAAENCTLFLWVTVPKLEECFEVIKAWGFVYKTVAFVWIKQTRKSGGWFMGCGHWTRANAEICLLATKGRPQRLSKSVRQLIVSPVEQHSKKPDVVRDRIVELVGDLPRLELFARQKAAGWDVWGNEVLNDIWIE